MAGKYLTRRQREQIEAYCKIKMKPCEIARVMGLHHSTIYRELKKGMYPHNVDYAEEWRYSAEIGQQKHDYAVTNKGRPVKLGHDYALADFLEKRMLGVQENGKTDRRKRCSPAVALELAKRAGFQTRICVTTLYSYISKGIFLNVSNKDLWEKPRRKKRGYEPVRRAAHPLLPSISERPDYINSREEPGHYEMDLVVSYAKGKGGVLTLTERAGRFEFIRKIPNRKAETIRAVLAGIKRKLPPGMNIKSITTDNGSEFLQYEELKAVVKCPIYYCHSYAAWEKGSSENHNRMIRRWFPKGTDFSGVSRNEIADCAAWMNDYPRKSLGWLTPREFLFQGNATQPAVPDRELRPGKCVTRGPRRA